MKDEDFNELMGSVKEAAAIMRGEAEPSRVFEIVAPDAAAIRSREKASQSEFAAMLGISVRTLQNWEQGRFTPDGPARVLLHVMDTNPEAVRAASRTLTKRVPSKSIGRPARKRGRPKSSVTA